MNLFCFYTKNTKQEQKEKQKKAEVNFREMFKLANWKKKCIKDALIDTRYFARSAFLRSLVQKKNWNDITNSLQVKTLILSKDVEYLFWVEWN